MNYCKYQNTLKLLKRCSMEMETFKSIQDAEEQLSEEELYAMLKIIEISKNIAEFDTEGCQIDL